MADEQYTSSWPLKNLTASQKPHTTGCSMRTVVVETRWIPLHLFGDGNMAIRSRIGTKHTMCITDKQYCCNKSLACCPGAGPGAADPAY